MLGKWLGRAVGLPFRVLNIPVKVGKKILDEATGGPCHPADDPLPIDKPLDVIAKTLEDATEEAIDGK